MKQIPVSPSAKRLTESLRDLGYSFEASIADLVDNSITAGASAVDIRLSFDGISSTVMVSDNGPGMDESVLDEAMRFGSRRTYDQGELGRYGLGLKTASFAHCRRLEVYTQTTQAQQRYGRCLDLDLISTCDDWITLDTTDEPVTQEILDQHYYETGTVVVWKKLDRILPSKNPTGGWAKRRLDLLGEKLIPHLAMIFHRFLAGEGTPKVTIKVNDTPITPWDPFARDEKGTLLVGEEIFELERNETPTKTGKVMIKQYILPTREQFSSREAHERLAGPNKWNRQQGIYIYRANRLVQLGGWAGIRTIDEHTKQARVSLEFDTDLDATFNIDVAKMRVTIPPQLKKMLTRPITELCTDADAAYRRSTNQKKASSPTAPLELAVDSSVGETVGIALKSAAVRTGNIDALKQIANLLKKESPEIAKLLQF